MSSGDYKKCSLLKENPSETNIGFILSELYAPASELMYIRKRHRSATE